MLSRSQVLADKGGKHHRHTHDRQKYKALDLCIGAVSGNRVGAESVDITLDHNIAHADHRVLDARRQSLADHLSHHVSVKMQLSKIQAGRLVRLPAHPDQTQYHTEPLGKHCGKGRPHYPPSKTCHKKQIQRHIYQGGQNQIVQRVQTVP